MMDILKLHVLNVYFYLTQEQLEMPGPPPAYETVVEGPPNIKDCHSLQVSYDFCKCIASLATIFMCVYRNIQFTTRLYDLHGLKTDTTHE